MTTVETEHVSDTANKQKLPAMTLRQNQSKSKKYQYFIDLHIKVQWDHKIINKQFIHHEP